MSDAFEILSDCATCLVEGAVVELLDPNRAAGVAVVARCRLCGREDRLGAEARPGQPPTTVEEAMAALSRWAAEDGETDVARFCEGGFAGRDLAEVCARLVARQPVETNFDVMAWLFGGMSGGGGAEPARASPSPQPSAPSAEPDPSPPAPPFHLGRALASVLLADGRASLAERSYVDRALAAAGQPPLAPEDLRVWRPLELGRPEDPGPVVALLAGLAWADGQRDETEWRVVREFSRAWAYPAASLAALDARLEAAHASLPAQLWSGLKRMFILERP